MNYQKKQKQITKMYAIYFLSMLLFCTLRIITSKQLIKISNYYVYELIYSFIVQGLIMVGIPLLLYFLLMPKKEHIVKSTLHFQPLKVKAIFLTIAIGVILFVANIGIASFFNGVIHFLGYETPVGIISTPVPSKVTVETFVFELFITAVVPAFCEEFLHRGLLLHGISPIGYRKAIIISSVLFGMMHMSISQVFYAAILGLVIGFLVVMTKSIWVGIILHFINNALNVYLAYASSFGWPGKHFYTYLDAFLTSSNFLVSIFAIVSMLAILVILLVYFISKLYKTTTLDRVGEAIKEVMPIGKEEEVLTTTIVEEMIKNNSTLTTEYSLEQNPLDIVLPKEKYTIKPRLKENIFLIGALVLGVLVNLSTFIWGLF